MTHPEQDLLTVTEGVDEGSAASATESPDTATGARPSTGAIAGPGEDESDPAPPSEVDTSEARRVRELGAGQQLEAGEG